MILLRLDLFLVRCILTNPKFIPIYDDAALIAIVAHFAGDHLHRHANFHRLPAQIGQLGGDHGAFVQLDNGNGIRGVAVETARGLIHGGIRENFTFAAEGILCFGFISAVGAYIARRKNFIIAVRAYFANKPVSLLF